MKKSSSCRPSGVQGERKTVIFFGGGFIDYLVCCHTFRSNVMHFLFPPPASSTRPDPPKNALAGFRSSAGLVEPAQVHFWRFSFFRRSYRAAGRRLRAENSIVRAGKRSKNGPGEPKPRLRA